MTFEEWKKTDEYNFWVVSGFGDSPATHNLASIAFNAAMRHNANHKEDKIYET